MYASGAISIWPFSVSVATLSESSMSYSAS
jgi:hypothetical protein